MSLIKQQIPFVIMLVLIGSGLKLTLSTITMGQKACILVCLFFLKEEPFCIFDSSCKRCDSGFGCHHRVQRRKQEQNLLLMAEHGMNNG